MDNRNIHDVAVDVVGHLRRGWSLEPVEQLPCAFGDFARMPRAYYSRHQLPIWPDEQRRRNRLDAHIIDHPLVSQHDWVVDLELLDERRDRLEPVALDQVARNADYHQATRLVVFLVECDQFRNLLAARPAPRRPEINDHGMAAVVA